MSKSVSQVRGVDDIIDEAGEEEEKIFESEKEDLIEDVEDDMKEEEQMEEEKEEQMIESTKEKGIVKRGRKRFLITYHHKNTFVDLF